MSTKFAPFTRSPEHERILESYLDAANVRDDYARWRRIAITAVATVALLGLVIIALAATRDNAPQRAACDRVATDLKALQDSADRTADRQELLAAAQVLVNAQAHQPGASWDDGQRRWIAAWDAQRTEDNYRTVVAQRALANLAACRG